MYTSAWIALIVQAQTLGAKT